MKFIRIHSPDQRLPRLYGVAHVKTYGRREGDDRILIAPIGVNVLVFMAVRLYYFLRTLPYEVPSCPREAFMAGVKATDAFAQGYESGRKAGEHAGYLKGYAAGREDTVEYAQAYQDGVAATAQVIQSAENICAFALSRPAPLAPLLKKAG